MALTQADIGKRVTLWNSDTKKWFNIDGRLGDFNDEWAYVYLNNYVIRFAINMVRVIDESHPMDPYIIENA